MKPQPIIPLILLLTSCAQPPVSQASQPEDTTVITTKGGQPFKITLDSNPTTGYQWKYSEDPEGVVKLVSNEYSPDQPQRIGSGGVDTWVFEGVKPGKTAITFEYVRPWKTEVEPEKTVRYEVRVQ